ncbi:UNVERIFIED_CONTAM: hypothetical protein HDU68_004219, partial [Siphonaria sp. JEL0065]
MKSETFHSHSTTRPTSTQGPGPGPSEVVVGPVTHASVSGLENVSERNPGVGEATPPTSEPVVVSSALVETDSQTMSPPSSVVPKVLIALVPSTLEALMDHEKIQNLNELCFDIKDQLLKSMNLDGKVEFIEIVGKDVAAVQSFMENAS